MAGLFAWPVEWLVDATVAMFFCVLGANIGSFLNVVAYRGPRGESVVRGGSRCPRCGHPVRWHDNVPVLAWLVLRGRCRDCGAAIAPRYALVEATAGAIGAIAAVELLSGGRTWPAVRFGTGRMGADALLVDADRGLALVCASHAALLFAILAWTLFEADRTRVPGAWFLGTAVGLAAAAVGAGGPIVDPGWPAVVQAAGGAAVGGLLGAAAANRWLWHGFVFVGLLLGSTALSTVVVIATAAAVGRLVGAWYLGCRPVAGIRCVDLLLATAVQLLAWRWLPAPWLSACPGFGP